MKDTRDYSTERNREPAKRTASGWDSASVRRPESRMRRDEGRYRDIPSGDRSGDRSSEKRGLRKERGRDPGDKDPGAKAGKRQPKGGKSPKRPVERRPANLKKLAIIAGVAAALLIIVYCAIAMSYSKKFLPHTYVNGFNVGRYSVAETEDVLRKSVEKYKLEIGFRGGKSEIITSQEMGLHYVSSNEVESLVSNQKRFGWLASIFGKKHYYTVKTSFQYDSAKLRSCLEALPEFNYDTITSPRNSTIVLDADLTFRTSTEFQGNEPNEEVVFTAVDEAVNSSVSRLSLDHVEDAYYSPTVTSTNEELVSKVKALNDYLETEVTIVYRDGTKDVIGRERLASWAVKDENGLYQLDDHTVYMQIYYMVEAAAEKYNEVHEYLDFNSTNNGVVRLWCSTPYGYKINVESQTDKIFSNVYAHKVMEYEIENAVSDSSDEKIGKTYIEVDITNQHVYYYIDGELYMDSDCVTGLESDPDRRTPSGAFAIFDLAEDQTLGSLTAADESQRYESFVDYWMPFYESYGLHDASWRDQNVFGGDVYTWAGSHGCVNLPVEFAQNLFKHLDVWTPVLVCRESDAAATSEHTLD